MAAEVYQLPMFPLGRVALIGETVPLRVFEPRYLGMLADVEAGSGEFGIALISRGSEVGGGDERFDVATATRIVRDVPIGDTQRAIVALAVRRIRVIDWLEVLPYPAAMVVEYPDEPAAGQPDIAEMVQRVRRLYALASELGADVGAVDLDALEDSTAGLWKLTSLVPLGEYDRQRLLAAPDAMTRAALLSGLIDDAMEELRLRLAEG